MKSRLRRGTVILGMIAVIALLGFLAYAANSAALSNYREAGRLRWRLTARQLAQGGLATARAGLAENPDWTGDIWFAEGVGLVEVRVVPLSSSPSPPSPLSPSPSPEVDSTGSAPTSATLAGVRVVEITTAVPPGPRPQEIVVLRARLDTASRSVDLPSVEAAWWVNAPAADEAVPLPVAAATDDSEARP